MPSSAKPLPNSIDSIGIDALTAYQSRPGFFDVFRNRFWRDSAELLDPDGRVGDTDAGIRLAFQRRWCPSIGGRYCIRRSHKSGDNENWIVFPHPDDVATGTDRCLVGIDGKIPCVLLQLRPWTNKQTDEVINHLVAVRILLMVIQKPDKDDVEFSTQLTISEPNPFWDVSEASITLIRWLKSLPSKQQEVTKRLEDWRQYLNWRLEDYRTNEWGAKIIKIHQWSIEDPIYKFEISAPEKVWQTIRRKSRGVEVLGMKKRSSASEEVWTRPEDPDDGSNRRGDRGKNAGKIKSVGKTSRDSDGMMRGVVRISPSNPEKPEFGLDSTWEGHFLINDIQRDLIQVERQIKALERLEKLESSSFNNLHEWIFDITKASPGPSQPPELLHDILSPLNEEQEAAVRGALAAPDAYLIQGPPGTGKTTVIAEIINQATSEGNRVLLASQSNLAVDNALGRLRHNSKVRPIRRVALSSVGDPDAEPFLEDNVVREFFIPSIMRVSTESQDASNELIENRDTLLRCQQDIVGIKDEWRKQHAKVAEVSEQVRTLADEERDFTATISSLRDDSNLVKAASTLLEDGYSRRLSEGMSRMVGIDHHLIAELDQYSRLTEEKDLLRQLLDHLPGSSDGGNVDPEAILLQEEEQRAAKAREYDKAKEAQEALASLDAKADDTIPDWVNWTRALHRLIPEFPENTAGLDELRNLSTELKKPDNFDSLVSEEEGRIGARISKIDGLLIELEASSNETLDTLKTLIPQRLGEISDEIEKETSSSEEATKDRKKLDNSLERHAKMRKDANDNWVKLIRALPEGVAEDLENIEGADPQDVIDGTKEWLETHSDEIEEDDKWRGIRASWIKELEEASAVTLQDLKEMYLRLVNVEGVTTAYSGMWSWYSDKLAEPFDIVIIDEISKATPPEILMPCLLGRKCILVGDHRQLPPTFKPGSSRSPDELDAEQFAELDKSITGFENMVKAALFAEHFQNAHESLKTTLTVQYRMHEQIMNCTNEFYEGQLTRGLTPEKQEETKQHGFTIRKKDSGGSHLREGSELINPGYHAVWVDSSFDRDGRYCCESQREGSTSRRNEREAHLARVLLDEFNTQIGEAKQNTPSEGWTEHHMLRHLNQDDRLPVAFITFYADQKRAFNEFANEGMAWTAMRGRWEHLTVRADTVDKFQGGERPVVIVSMVVSGKYDANKDLIARFESDVADLIDSPINMTKRKEFKPGRIAGITTPFIRSPERINVAFSRAQNLLVILGNRYSLDKVAPESGKNQGVRITRDDGSVTRRPIYRQIQQNIGEGGMVDGRDLL